MKNFNLSCLLGILFIVTLVPATAQVDVEATMAQTKSDTDSVWQKAYLDLASHFLRKDSVQFFDVVNKALSRVTENEDFAGTMLLKIGNYYELTNRLDSSRAYYSRALHVHERTNSYSGQANAWRNLAFLEKTQLHFDLAVENFQKSQALYLKAIDSLNYYQMMVNIGLCFENQGKYQQAADWYFKGLKYFDRTGNLAQQALFRNNLGVVFSFMKDLDGALRYHKEALQIRMELQDSFAIAQSYVNIGQTFIHKQMLDSAKGPTKEAYRIFNKIEHWRGASIALSNIALIAQYQGDHPTSITTNRETIELAKKTGDEYQLAIGYLNIAAPLILTGQLDQGQLYLDTCLTLSLKMKSYLLLTNVYESLAEVQKMKNNFKQAYDYKELQLFYKDSLINEQNTETVSNLKTQYETEKKEQEIATLKAETQVQKLQIAQTRILIIAIATIALLVVLILIFINRQKGLRLKQQLQRERFRTVIEAEEGERKRVARELHDGLGQMLSTVRLYVSDFDDRRSNPKVDRSLNALDATIAEVRSISHNMMPIKLMELGLMAALKDMADRVNDSSKLKMEVAGNLPFDLPETESIALYRSIQEVVNNAIKYAKANRVSVKFLEDSQYLQVLIEDDGQGFNTENIAKSKGIGWSNIYARMELIGGSVKVSSKIGTGTQVSLAVPAAIYLKVG